VVGGLWEDIGNLYINFLKSQGLKPDHKVLDIGCGSLRGGVKLIPYLESGNYYGIDKNQSLLNAGWNKELKLLSLHYRQPRKQLVHLKDFEFQQINTHFDFAIALSLFTHLPLNRIRKCLNNLSCVMQPGAVFFATFFESCKQEQSLIHKPGGITTYTDHDPFHYSYDDFQYLIKDLPWKVLYIGECNHPRAQKMLAFIRDSKLDEGNVINSDTRFTKDKSIINTLAAGAHHYRAYVGPPNRYDFMSATQFNLLFSVGLRENHHVLDFGAGSLRLGRLLIPFLNAKHYWAIETERWLITDAIENEIGYDILKIKSPSFSYDSDFNCFIFNKKFDFIMAQSMVTHCGPDLIQKFFSSCKKSLTENGILLLSYIKSERKSDAKLGWLYPECIGYTEEQMILYLNENGFHATTIPWYHPGASWIMASLNKSRLPDKFEKIFLSGAVLNVPQFSNSLKINNK